MCLKLQSRLTREARKSTLIRSRHTILSRRRRVSGHRSSRPLNNGGIAGVVIGVVVVLIILLALYLYARRQKRPLGTETLENRVGADTQNGSRRLNTYS